MLLLFPAVTLVLHVHTELHWQSVTSAGCPVWVGQSNSGLDRDDKRYVTMIMTNDDTVLSDLKKN